MDAPRALVVFRLQGQRYALRLAVVERVVAVAEITLLPQAPVIVLGVINMGGRVVPVVDVQRRFGLPGRDIELSDRLIVARSSCRTVALLVQCVDGLIYCSQTQVEAAHDRYIEGVVKLADGLVLIHDLDTFLSPLEERTLQQALASA